MRKFEKTALILLAASLSYCKKAQPKLTTKDRFSNVFIIDGTDFGISPLAQIHYSGLDGSLGFQIPGDQNVLKTLGKTESRKWSWLKGVPLFYSNGFKIPTTVDFCIELNEASVDDQDFSLVLQARRKITGTLCYKKGILTFKGLTFIEGKQIEVSIQWKTRISKSKIF